MDDILIPSVTHEGRRADFSVWVPGTPRPQGSKSRNRRGGMYEASPHLRTWRADVRARAILKYHPQHCRRHLLNGCKTCGTRTPALTGPLMLGVVFVMRRPGAHYLKRKSGLVLRDDAPEYHCDKGGPDFSKLLRAVEDSLTDAGVWGDDGQVSAIHGISGKRYTPRSWPRERTGVAIWVWKL